MEALRGATYEELVDSGVRPVHAKLILSNLGSKGGYGGPLSHGTPGGTVDEVNHFLRSVGLENCASELAEAGFTSLDKLGAANMQELLAAGLKPVHARLIVSNLDSASTAGIHMTPAAQRLATLESEADDALLGLPRKRRPRRARLAVCVIVLLFVLAAAFHSLQGGGGSGGAAGAGASSSGGASGAATSMPDGGKAGGEHKGGKGHGGGGGGGVHGGKGPGMGGKGGHASKPPKSTAA